HGLRVVAGAVLSTRGRLRILTGGRYLELVPQDSGDTLVSVIDQRPTDGTRIEIWLGGAMSPSSLEWATAAINMAHGGVYKGNPSLYDGGMGRIPHRGTATGVR